MFKLRPKPETCAALLAMLAAWAAWASGVPATAQPAGTFYATATVRERPLDSATAAVCLIDREEIEASGATNVLQMLAMVPGLSVVGGGGRGAMWTVQIRGGDPNFTRVLVDGVPVNDGTYQVGEVFDFAALPLEAVERIEVVRGPFSSHYGSTGLAGVVQVFTRLAAAEPRAELGLVAGNADLRRATLTLAARRGEWSGFLGLVDDQEAGRVAEEKHHLRHLQGQLTGRAWQRFDLRLSTRLADFENADYPDASGGPVWGSGELRRGEREEAGLGLTLQSVRHRFEIAVYHHALERVSPAIVPLVPAAVEATRFERRRLGWAFSQNATVGRQLNLGLAIENEGARNQSLLLLPPFLGGAVTGDYRGHRTSGGLFAELLEHRGNFSYELALRGDLIESESQELSPRVGLAWRPNGGSTRLRASAGRAFKLPSFFALASPPALGGNPELRPESSLGADVGLAHEAAISGGSYQVELGVFVQRYTDLVDFDFATFRHVNRSRVNARGVETSLAWHYGSRLSFQSNVTWQEVENADNGEGLRHRPRWTGATLLRWLPRETLSFAADLRFSSSSLDQQLPVPDRRQVAGYKIVGLAAGWHATPSWQVTARVDNLLDSRYETLIGFPGPTRSFHVGLAVSMPVRRDGR